ncbi:MCE family protein [Streptomyces sp. TLI_146]|uniref:MCE family protein n=1 Tax=Streptomyces sp. TLI_146 TaxID=1938858 RepID=UPI000C704853|nr:MCE family protein [Streptomyces sp. TLI_146]
MARPRGAAAPRPRKLLALGVAFALLVAAGVSAVAVRVLGDDGALHLTAYFDRTVGVHEGSDLRVLGVRVGSVGRIRPEGRQVRVALRVRKGVRIPQLVRAVVVAPSVVSGRFVQLSPAYSGSGPMLADGAVIPRERTATPMEVDELAKSVSGLVEALGPDGANKKGALSDLIDTGAKNLKGNGDAVGRTVQQLGGAAKVLGGSSADLVRTVRRLQSFVTMLKENDGTVRTTEQRLGDVTTFLAGEKDDLAAALGRLGTALGQVRTFIRDNRGKLKKDVDRLATLTQSLVDQRASLGEALDTLPLAAANLENAYDPATRTIDGRADLNELGPLPLPAAETYGRPSAPGAGR